MGGPRLTRRGGQSDPHAHAVRTPCLSRRTVSISRGIQSLGEREGEMAIEMPFLSLSVQGDSGGLTGGLS